MTQFAEPHWTDNYARRSIFDTVIPARGPAANIYAITGTAYSLMRQLRLPTDRIDALKSDIAVARSYEAAIACVEKWFKVDRGED